MPKPSRSFYRNGIVVCLVTLLFSAQVKALTFDLGASFSQPVFDVRDENNHILAQNAAETSVWPYISLQSKERYIGDSHWGYSLSAMAWYFSMDKQKNSSGKLVDYNTSVEGYYAYLTPTFYYRFGDKYIMESKDTWNWTLGIGFGVGMLVANGTTYTDQSSTPSIENISVDNAALSSGIFVELERNRWFARFSSYGPSADVSPTRNVRLNDNSFIIGRRFDLEEFFK